MPGPEHNQRPLEGRVVVVTRPQAQAGGLVERMRDLGAETVAIAAIEIGPPADGGRGLAAAAGRAVAGHYGTVVFTSANGVEQFFNHVVEVDASPATTSAAMSSASDPRGLEGARVAAIGPGTAAALHDRGVRVDLVPRHYVAESLLAALGAPPPGGLRERRVLIARAAVARDVLPAGLRAAGWEVDVVEAYRTRRGTPGAQDLDRAADADAICFTSPSTVEHYLALAAGRRMPTVVVCIGPVTAAAARERDLAVAAEADPHTIPGLVDAVVEALATPAQN